MRKTTSYFVRKMELMQKLTTMDWIGEIIRRKNKGEKKKSTHVCTLDMSQWKKLTKN